ncbi:1217_t:CDS:2, partial [Entrophospora sp. SA101]
VIGNDEETKTVLVKNNNNTYACLLAKHTDFSRSEGVYDFESGSLGPAHSGLDYEIMR